MMLNWIRDIVRPLRITDPLFGELQFLRETQVWEGCVVFEPAAKTVEVLLTASAAGPTEQQRRWFTELSQRFATLLSEVEPLLRAAAATYGGTNDEDFALIAVSLPEMTDEASTWGMTFQRRATGRHYDVQMTGWTATAVDGEL